MHDCFLLSHFFFLLPSFFNTADEFIKELLVHSDIQQSILTGLVGLLKPDDTGRAMLG